MVLSKLISDSESTFVFGRQITDNVFIAYELIHYLRRIKRGKQGYMSIKLDISKTYDRVELDYLERVLATMGFHMNLINLIMQCLKSVSFSLLVNRVPKGPIIPSRGLR